MNQSLKLRDSDPWSGGIIKKIDGSLRSNSVPAVTGLSFKFRPLLYTGRIINSGREDPIAFEIWSPNSQRHPFFPGHFPLFVDFPKMSAFSNRFDGSGGRFDPTLIPQVFDKNQFWLPFISRSGRHRAECEHDFFHETWKDKRLAEYWTLKAQTRNDELDSAMNPLRTQLSTSDLPLSTTPSPSFPTREDISPIGRPGLFRSQVITTYQAVVRGMKAKAAWVRAVQSLPHLLESFSSPPSEVHITIPADENLMGCFINSADAPFAAWMAGQGVPLFVVHALEYGACVPQHLNLFPDFYTGSELENALSPDKNYWVRLQSQSQRPKYLSENLRALQYPPCARENLHQNVVVFPCLAECRHEDQQFFPISSWSGRSGCPFGKWSSSSQNAVTLSILEAANGNENEEGQEPVDSRHCNDNQVAEECGVEAVRHRPQVEVIDLTQCSDEDGSSGSERRRCKQGDTIDSSGDNDEAEEATTSAGLPSTASESVHDLLSAASGSPSHKTPAVDVKAAEFSQSVSVPLLSNHPSRTTATEKSVNDLEKRRKLPEDTQRAVYSGSLLQPLSLEDNDDPGPPKNPNVKVVKDYNDVLSTKHEAGSLLAPREFSLSCGQKRPPDCDGEPAADPGKRRRKTLQTIKSLARDLQQKGFHLPSHIDKMVSVQAFIDMTESLNSQSLENDVRRRKRNYSAHVKERRHKKQIARKMARSGGVATQSTV